LPTGGFSPGAANGDVAPAVFVLADRRTPVSES